MSSPLGPSGKTRISPPNGLTASRATTPSPKIASIPAHELAMPTKVIETLGSPVGESAGALIEVREPRTDLMLKDGNSTIVPISLLNKISILKGSYWLELLPPRESFGSNRMLVSLPSNAIEVLIFAGYLSPLTGAVGALFGYGVYDFYSRFGGQAAAWQFILGGALIAAGIFIVPSALASLWLIVKGTLTYFWLKPSSQAFERLDASWERADKKLLRNLSLDRPFHKEAVSFEALSELEQVLKNKKMAELQDLLIKVSAASQTFRLGMKKLLEIFLNNRQRDQPSPKVALRIFIKVANSNPEASRELAEPILSTLRMRKVVHLFRENPELQAPLRALLRKLARALPEDDRELKRAKRVYRLFPGGSKMFHGGSKTLPPP